MMTTTETSLLAQYPTLDEFRAAHAAQFDARFPAVENEVVTHVVFDRIHPNVQYVVPVAEAFDLYEKLQDSANGQPGFASICRAIVSVNDGTFLFWTFAGARSVWDFTARVRRLVYVGLGAGHDWSEKSPVNPDRSVMTASRVQRYSRAAGWVTGINPTPDYDAVAAEVK